MWFAFGVISLISFTIYFGNKRYQNNWPGLPGRVGNVVYSYHTIKDKEKTTTVFLGCQTIGDLDFSIKPETNWDRFFKAVGISVEYQIGRDEFDRDVYVISDHAEVCKVLGQSAELQDKIQHLLQLSRDYAMNFKSLHIHNKRIWVKLAPRNQSFVPDTSTLAKAFIPILDSICKVFAAKLSHCSSGLKDPFYWKAAVFLAISTGMAITGGVHLAGLTFIHEPYTVDTNELFYLSFLVGSIVTGALVFLTLLFLGRTARTHLVILELISIGYFGAISSTMALARDINMEWDSASTQQYIVQVHDKSISRGRRHTSYYLHIDDWLNPGYQKKVSVSSSKYHNFEIGAKLKVIQHPGYLGFRWVSEMSGCHEFLVGQCS